MFPWQTGFAKFAYGSMTLSSSTKPARFLSKGRRIPPSELTEDANKGHARVVREQGVYADFAIERLEYAK
jgi:hypothetical protein